MILNPKSGGKDEHPREAIEALLRDRGTSYEILETSPENDAVTLARRAIEGGARHLIAGGGDGTVMGVINGIGANQSGAEPVVLSILPAGTANLFAKSLEIPTEMEKAVEIALNGATRTVDLGRRGDTLFALGIGVGVSERLVSGADDKLKDRLGRFAYVLALGREVGCRPLRFQLELDGKESIDQMGVAVVIANVGEIGGMQIAPEARSDDGLLDVCVLHRFGFLDALRLAGRALIGPMKSDREITVHQARKVVVTTSAPMDVQIDGEEVDDKTPVTAEVVPGALHVRVPTEATAAG